MPVSTYWWLPSTSPVMPAGSPGGPNGDSTTVPTSSGVPSPQSIVAVWLSSVPLSPNVAGPSRTVSPGLAVCSAPASTVGATLLTVTVSVSAPTPPSSSVTVSVTV